MASDNSWSAWFGRLPAPLGRPLLTWFALIQSQIILMGVLVWLRSMDADFVMGQLDADPLGVATRILVPAVLAAGGWLLFFSRRESAIAFCLHGLYLLLAGIAKSAEGTQGGSAIAIDVACAVYALRILPAGQHDGIRPIEAALPWILRRPTFLWVVIASCLSEVFWSIPWDPEHGSLLTRATQGLSPTESMIAVVSEIGLFASAVFLIALRKEGLYLFVFVLACVFVLFLGDSGWIAKALLAKDAMICVYLTYLVQAGVLRRAEDVEVEPPAPGVTEQVPGAAEATPPRS